MSLLDALKDLFWPLEQLTGRERFIFIEYFYFKTQTKVIADDLRIKQARVYVLLNRAKEKVKARVEEASEEELKIISQYHSQGDILDVYKVYGFNLGAKEVLKHANDFGIQKYLDEGHQLTKQRGGSR